MKQTIEAISGPFVWRKAEIADSNDWIVPIEPAGLEELAGAVADARGRGEDGLTIDIDRYCLAGTAELAAKVRNELRDGYGFCLLRGIPVDRFTVDELKMLLLVLGNHIGLIGPQEQGPRSIGEVVDTGPDMPKDFYYHRGGALPMHVDPVDVVGLMCVRAAKWGGASGIVSAMAVHNELLRENPEALRLLYRGFRRMKRHKAEDRECGLLTDEPVPVYTDIGGGEMICTFLTEAVQAAVHAGLMVLDAREQEALALMEHTAERSDLMLATNIEPGDIQLLNNRVIMHNRFDYEDFPERDRRRLMLRLWLTMPGWKKFPETIPYLDVETGRLPE